MCGISTPFPGNDRVLCAKPERFQVGNKVMLSLQLKNNSKFRDELRFALNLNSNLNDHRSRKDRKRQTLRENEPKEGNGEQKEEGGEAEKEK